MNPPGERADRKLRWAPTSTPGRSGKPTPHFHDGRNVARTLRWLGETERYAPHQCHSHFHGGPTHHRLLGGQEKVLSNIAMSFECKTQHLFRAFGCSLKVFRSGSCLEEIWKQRPFGCAAGSEAGSEGHQAVSFCLLVQLSLCLPPSSFSHSSCPSRKKDTFPAEHPCGSPSPNKYGSWVLTAAAGLC